MMMKKISASRSLILAGSVVGLFCFNVTAASADEVSNGQWTGFYAGGELGAASADLDWKYKNANWFNTFGPALLGTDFDHDASGAIGGLFAGYNHQVDSWVFGFEISAAATDLKERKASPLFPTDVYTSEINWLAKVTGRVGYAWDRWLVFAKAGWAGADVELKLDDDQSQIHAKSDGFENGWTAGIGAEYRLYDRVSLGIVYDYVNLDIDNNNVRCPRCGTGVGAGTPVVEADIDVQSIMLRLSIRFPD
jgi:outer membrane immunogenic protein